MAKIVAVTDAIKSLAEAEAKLGLGRTEDEHFFTEWQASLPELNEADLWLFLSCNAGSFTIEQMEICSSNGDTLGCLTVARACRILRSTVQDEGGSSRRSVDRRWGRNAARTD